MDTAAYIVAYELSLLAQTPADAVDAASRIEQLSIIGVLALIAIAFGWLLWRLYAKQLADKDATIARLLEERNASQKRERDLHAFIDDTVIPLVTEANRATARNMRRVLDSE